LTTNIIEPNNAVMNNVLSFWIIFFPRFDIGVAFLSKKFNVTNEKNSLE
jgi:hypothetical protein